MRRHGATLLAVDSEHNAIFQVLTDASADGDGVERLVLTASGGPFPPTFDRAAMAAVTRRRRFAHPDLGHGRQDLGRQRHHDEQGA